jgi:hypothetical protein
MSIHCEKPSQVNLWDNKEMERLNRETKNAERTNEWKKQHYVAIADHLVAFKDFSSDDVIKYPLTYDSNYHNWGGKLKHD